MFAKAQREYLPDPEKLIGLQDEEAGLLILSCLFDEQEIKKKYPGAEVAVKDALISPDMLGDAPDAALRDGFIQVMTEGYVWLKSQAFIGPTQSGRVFITRRGLSYFEGNKERLPEIRGQ